MEKVGTKWYDHNGLLDLLLFIFPPLAAVGLVLNKRIKTPFRVVLITFSVLISGVYAFALINWIGN